MIKCVMILCIITTCNVQAFACDVCGCSTNISSIGIYNAFHRNYIYSSYGVTTFTASVSNRLIKDQFHTFGIGMRYGFFSRLYVSAHIPLNVNVRHDIKKDVQQLISGLGDIALKVMYVFLDRKINENVALYSEVQAGVAIPSGRIEKELHEQGLPDLFNPGKGSVGGLFTLQSLLRIASHHILLTSSSRVYVKTRNDYQYGTQMQASLLYYYESQWASVTFLLGAGPSIDWAGVDRYSNGHAVHGTGGIGVFMSPTLVVTKNKLQINIGGYIPIQYYYAQGESKPLLMGNFQLTYFL